MELRSHWYFTLVHNPVNNLKPVKPLFDYFPPLFPTNTPFLPFGGIHASRSLLGSKSATDESVKVFVFTGFPR